MTSKANAMNAIPEWDMVALRELQEAIDDKIRIQCNMDDAESLVTKRRANVRELHCNGCGHTIYVPNNSAIDPSSILCSCGQYYYESPF